MHGKEVAMSPISRRRFLTTAATAAGSVALGCGDHPMIAPRRAQLIGGLLPDPASCGIEHVVVFMMENRSFDHFLGWLPGADGRQAGLTYADSSGVTPRPFPWPRTSRAAATTLPTTPTRADGWSTTTARATGGYGRTTSSPSVTTASKTSPSSAARFPTGRPSTNTSAPSSARHSLIAFTSTRARPTGLKTASPSLSCRPSGTGWPPAASWAGTTTATCRSWGCGAPSMCRSAGRSDGGKRRWPTRLPHADPAHLTLRAPAAYVAHPLRPHVGAADDRVALGPGPPYRARRDGQQPGR